MTTTARIWLVIAHGGGRWTVADVREKLPEENPISIEQAIGRMSNKGMLRLYERDGQNRLQRFGVTPQCYVPQGLTNGGVLEAMGMQLRPGIEEVKLSRGTSVLEVMAQAVQRLAA